jgi:hypothetical protein
VKEINTKQNDLVRRFWTKSSLIMQFGINVVIMIQSAISEDETE